MSHFEWGRSRRAQALGTAGTPKWADLPMVSRGQRGWNRVAGLTPVGLVPRMDEDVPSQVDDRGGRRHRAEVDVGRRLSLLLGLRGVLALLFGVLVLVWPDVTVLALALVFAAYAVVDGIGMIADGLGGDGDRRRRWFQVVAGVVGIVAGVVAALWPGITALVLIVVVGTWAVVTGALEIVAAVRLRTGTTGRWVLAVSGVVSLIAGVIILARPEVGALALASVVAIYALLAGVALLWAAWQVRTARVVVLRTDGSVSASD
jgi:uncharacterized membrane protein HdeD (DUF308 family)